MKNKYSHMHFVGYKSIPNWSVGYILGHNLGFTEKYPLARIGDFIRPAKNAIVVEDDKEYKQVTLKTNGGGAVLRGVMKGSSIGTKKQFLAKEGQFVMSKIDARNGAFGIISKELNGAIVTGDFPLFDVNSDLISTEYLFLISTTKSFVRFVQSCSRGTTNRRRIDVNLFLQQQIPLPSLEEQKTLVDAYNQYLVKASQLEEKALINDESIISFVNDRLGLVKSQAQKNDLTCLLRFINYKDTYERWDPFNANGSIHSIFPMVKLAKLITDISTGTTPPTSHKEFFNGDIKFYTPADIGKEMYLDTTERTLAQPAISAKKARLFHKGQLLFVGIGSTVGKIGIVSDEQVSSNQQITGFSINSSIATPEYVYCYMHCNKDITTAERTKTTLPVVNQAKIEQIPIPLPPLSVQQEIVDEVQKRRAQIALCREQAAKLRQDAIAQFERTIFE